MSDDSTRYAFVVNKMHGSRTSIREAEKHAQGTNRSARARRRAFADARALALYLQPDGTLSEPRAVYPADHPKGGGDQPELDLVAAYDRHMKLHSARRYGRSHHLAYHLIVGVSPAYFEGNLDDRHDPDSEAVRTLMASAVEWAERDIGGVWHARYDVDEDGCGIVDVCCTPLRTDPRNGRKWISTRKPQAALSKKWRRPTGYGAFQDAWADYFTKRMARTYQRGRPKEETGREHLVAEVYGAGMDDIARLKAENKELHQEQTGLRKALNSALAKLGLYKAQRDKVTGEIAEAEELRDTARHEAEGARREKAKALRERDEARAETREALQERDQARRERDTARSEADQARKDTDRARRERDMAKAALGRTGGRLKAVRQTAGRFSSRLTGWAVGLLRTASRPHLPPDPEIEGEGTLAEEAQIVAVDMALVAEPKVKGEVHRKRIRSHVRGKLDGGGWEQDDPQAPLFALYEAEGSPADSDDPYYDWRLDLAHSSARARDLDERAKASGYDPADLKDCLRLARRLERDDGRYLSRKERRQAAAAGIGLAAETARRRRRGSAPAGFSR